MQKIIKGLSSILLLAAASSVFSADLTCPPLSQIRNYSTLQRAAQIGPQDKYGWAITSNAFNYSDASWNVVLFVTLPKIDDPATAVKVAQDFMDHSVLVQPTILAADGDHMTCRYTAQNYKYSVVAVTPANFGMAI
jgi:hypothetical protein